MSTNRIDTQGKFEVSRFTELLSQAKLDGIERVNVAAVIPDGEGKILVCLRSETKKYYPSVWHLPGGKVEEGETIEEALAAELKEELNLDLVDIIDFTGVVMDYAGHGVQKSRTLFFHVEVSGDILLNQENQDYTYFDRDQAQIHISKAAVDYNMPAKLVELDNWDYLADWLQTR